MQTADLFFLAELACQLAGIAAVTEAVCSQWYQPLGFDLLSHVYVSFFSPPKCAWPGTT